MLCDANGVPLKFLLSGGQASDIAYAQPLLDEAHIPSLRGRPRRTMKPGLNTRLRLDELPSIQPASEAPGTSMSSVSQAQTPTLLQKLWFRHAVKCSTFYLSCLVRRLQFA